MSLFESPQRAVDSRTPLLLSWSGGKDSAMALWQLQQSPRWRVTALLTTLTRDFDRISMHGVRRELLQRQAQALQLPLQCMWINAGASNTEYEASFAEAARSAREQATGHVAFGDLYLREVRAYRERLLQQQRLTAEFPLWGRDTSELIAAFLQLGFKAVVVCVDPRQLPREFVGRLIDSHFLQQLPPGVDPCGENGEFHSFVFDGPNFSEPIALQTGAIVLRDQFWFCDVLPRD